MKKTLLSLVAWACPLGFAIAQTCTPDLSITQPGMYPDIATNLPYAYVGTPYSTSVQFKVITDTTVNGTYVTVTNVTLDSVSGMPAGFSYSSNPVNHIFPGGSNACATLFGNPLSGLVGTHHLVVHLTVHGIAFGFVPVSQATTVTGYKIKIFGAPVANFSGTPTTVCEGDAVLYADNSTNHPTNWQWSFPGGTPSSSSLQIPPPIIYAASGNKDITLIVSSPAGSNTKTKTSYVNVNAGPAAATISPSGNISVCTGSVVTLSANTGSGLTYQWLKNGVNISGATASTYTASATGDYSVQVSIASGCSKTSQVTSLDVSNIVATVTASGPTSFCDGENVTLTANSGMGFNYQWKKDGTNIPGETNISYAATVTGNYKVMITNSGGCTDISSGTTVSVNSLPSAAITANGPITFCKGNNVTLTANTGSGLTYQWTSAYVPVSGATNSSFVAHARGWFRATVSNSNGCSAVSNLIHVYVDTLPSATISSSGPLTFCQGQSVTLTANSGNGLTYQWTKHDVNIPGATNISFTPVMWGRYRVITTNSFGCTKTSNKKLININPLPSASITASGALTFCQGQSVTLTANAGIGLSYQWTKNWVDIPGETGNSYLAKKTGGYRVVVTNLTGCSKTSSKSSVLVNCREENENVVSSEETDAIIYPNPTSAITTIVLNLIKEGNVSIKMFDVAGKLVADVAAGNFKEGRHEFTFDASALEAGVYLIQIRTNDRLISTKIVVNKN